MDHHSHVILVHPHAERVGGTNDLEFTIEECVLDAFLLRHKQPGMEVCNVPALPGEKRGRLLCGLA